MVVGGGEGYHTSNVLFSRLIGHAVTLHMQPSRPKQGVTLSSGGTSRPHKSLPRSKMDYEAKFFPCIGGFGRYTKKVVLWSWFPSFAVALNLTSSVFLTMTPEKIHCRPDPSLGSVSKLPEEERVRASGRDEGGPGQCELIKYLNGSIKASGSSDAWEKVPCTLGWVYSTEVGLQNNLVTEVRVGTWSLFLFFVFVLVCFETVRVWGGGV